MSLYTIGHSILSEPDFLKVMGAIPVLMDVRSHPTSKWPQFRMEELQRWIPAAGKRYIWEPGLGGWDIRHAEDQSLREAMLSRHLDLARYSKGKFPKGHIAGYRLDTGMIRRQLLHGCNCGIAPGIQAENHSELAMRTSGSRPLSRAGVAYLRQLCDRLSTYKAGALRSTDRSFPPHNVQEPLPGIDADAQSHTDDASLRLLAGEYKRLFSTRGKRGTSARPSSSGRAPSASSILSKWAQEICPHCSMPLVAPQWFNAGLYDYSLFMALPEFVEAADRLMELSRDVDVAIMCCECLYWACHRSMIADYVVWRGLEVRHLQPRLTSHTKSLGNRLQRYDDFVIKAWERHAPGRATA